MLRHKFGGGEVQQIVRLTVQLLICCQHLIDALGRGCHCSVLSVEIIAKGDRKRIEVAISSGDMSLAPGRTLRSNRLSSGLSTYMWASFTRRIFANSLVSGASVAKQ